MSMEDEIDLLKQNAFAVVQLKPGMETRLLRVLIENGYTNVSFTNAQGEMIKLIDERDDRSVERSDHEDTDEDQDEDVEIDIEDIKENDDIEEIKENRDTKPEPIDDWSGKKSVSIGTEDQVINENRGKIIVENPIKSIETPSPINFSSLTLPTVLWGAGAGAQSIPDQPKFPSTAFPYNPFLSVPFLPYLQSEHQNLINTLKGDLPYFPQNNESTILPPGSLWNPHHSHHPGQLLDTPPSTPRSSGSSDGSNCLITGAKLRQRGRQLRRHERDSSAYASCRLCRNRILANRLSNLHNHVRRHAVLKQFHCCYCSYAHTEVAKVRLHMLHNHKDDRSQPLDKRNDDMEAAWSMLMRECFPGYA